MRTVYCVFPPLPVGQRGKHRSYGFMLLLIGWDPRTCGTYVKQEGRSRGGGKWGGRAGGGQVAEGWGIEEKLVLDKCGKNQGQRTWGLKSCVFMWVELWFVSGIFEIELGLFWSSWWNSGICPLVVTLTNKKGDLVGRIYHPPRSWLFP